MYDTFNIEDEFYIFRIHF